MQSNFMFYDNFLEAINQLPESERANACYQFCKYAITDELPEDKSLAMFCVGVRYSVHKYQGRGGARAGAGRPKKSNEEENQKNQKNQNIQKNQNTQTETETKTETEKEIHKEKESDAFVAELEKEKLAKATPEKKVIDWGEVQNRWERIATKYKLSKISVLTDKRKQQFKARLAEHQIDTKQFFDIVNKALWTSQFLQGYKMELVDGEVVKIENDNKWKASFDFFLQSSSFAKARENKYASPELLIEFEELEKQQGGTNAD